MREFRTFSYRGASYRISPAGNGLLYNAICGHIKELREELEAYIKRQPQFLSSLEPVEILSDAPESARLMAEAAELTGIGPMAAVAGTLAELAARRTAESTAGKQDGANEIIIENGGDIFILPRAVSETAPVTAAIFSGLHSKFSSLALKIIPDGNGTAVCSSSGRMGHSLSLGDCDLCTVISPNAALADAAATLGGNLVSTESDLGPAADKLISITGIEGVLLIKNEKMAMAGRLPQIIRHSGLYIV